MAEVKKQTLTKINNQYKAGVYFSFNSLMTQILSDALNAITKDAKGATERFNGIGSQDVGDLLKDTAKESQDVITKNILEIDKEL